MMTRIAKSYVFVLFTLEGLLFGCSLILHFTIFLLGVSQEYERYTHSLLSATILLAIPASAFIKDSLRWVAQIRKSPTWMWRTALGIGIYTIVLLLVQWVIPHNSLDNPMPLAFTAYGAAFGAISCCVLFPVLRRGIFNDAQIIQRFRTSVIFIGIVFAVVVADRAGYIPHTKTYSDQPGR